MDSSIKDEIARVLPNIQSNYEEGKWVPKENMHVTMLFLGEVPESKIELVKEAMAEAVSGMAAFSLRVEGMGVFPDEKRPKILWGGINGDLDDLNKLYQKLVAAIEKKGLPCDAKPTYRPHLTLARKISDGIAHKSIKLTSSAWWVDSLVLYQSVLHSSGVQYKQVFTEKM